MNPTSANTLLDYSLDTAPDPLQVSPQTGDTVYGSLTFVVSNGGTEAVSVTRIQFTLPIGTGADQLTDNANAVLFTANPASDWALSMPIPGLYVAVPQSGDPVTVTTNGIVFQLFNIPINQQVGTASVAVAETASSSSAPSQARSADFDVAKFPFGFFFSNFSPSAPQVPDSSPVTLTWEGSDQATYTMKWDDQSADVTEVRTWTSPSLTKDTTFQLEATVVSVGETVTVAATTTVTVANPELEATSLQVTGISALQGATTIGDALTVNAGMSVTGPATLASATVSGTLTASGTATVGTLGVTDGLTVNGGTTVGELTATAATNLQALDVAGAASLSGVIAMLQGPQTISTSETKTYTAPTDGLVIGYVTTWGQGASPKANYWGGFSINSMFGLFHCITMNFMFWGPHGGSSGVSSGSAQLAVPITKGSSFTIQPLGKNQGGQSIPQRNAWWVPLGSTEALQEATAVEAARLPAMPPAESFEPVEFDANALTHLAEILERPVDDAVRERLAKALRALLA